MAKNLLRKCLLVSCIFITLCPRRGRFIPVDVKDNNEDNKNYTNSDNDDVNKNGDDNNIDNPDNNNDDNKNDENNNIVKPDDDNKSNNDNNDNNENENDNNNDSNDDNIKSNNDNIDDKKKYDDNNIGKTDDSNKGNTDNNDNFSKNNKNYDINDNNDDTNNGNNNSVENINYDDNNIDKPDNKGNNDSKDDNNKSNNDNIDVEKNDDDNIIDKTDDNNKGNTDNNVNISKDNNDYNTNDNNDNTNNGNNHFDDNDNYGDTNNDKNDVKNNENNDDNYDDKNDKEDLIKQILLNTTINNEQTIHKTKTLSVQPEGDKKSADLLGNVNKKKLKDLIKGPVVTLWTGLQNAEPGFDFDADEMEKFKIWPRGDIPYYIDDYSFDTTLQTRIRDIITAVNSVTGLHFFELQSPPIDEKTRFVFFINRRGVLPCVDYTNKNFTTEGAQKVVLGYDCLSVYNSLGGLILAIAGVPPQHNSPDRDTHIEVLTDNIIPDKRHLFEKLPNNEWLFHEVEYDYKSAGHYDLFKYTANGKATIKLPTYDVKELDDEGLSYADLWKIRMLYNYISRKRPTIGKSDCSKLFVPGNKFKEYRPDSDDEITPRRKPAKYLGKDSAEESEQLDQTELSEGAEQNEQPAPAAKGANAIRSG